MRYMIVAFFKRHHRRIAEIGAGLFLFEVFNFCYDFLFYPFAVAYWGIVNGGAIATALTFPINAFIFWLYEYMRVDWLGAHALRQLEDKENKSRTEKLMVWLGKSKTSWWEKLLSPVVFVGLLVPIDPVIVAIHYQKQHFQGIGWKDWGLLLVATVVANGWWLLKVGVVVEGARFVWEQLI